MTIQFITHGKTLPALVMASAMALFALQPAAAQNAGKLKCKGCVSSKHVKNNGIKSSDIKDGQVRNADLANGAITGAKIADRSVGSADLAHDSVDGRIVESESIPATDLSNEPGAAFVDGGQKKSLFPNPIVVRSVVITAPTPGLVIVNASGYFFGDVAGTGECIISRGSNAIDSARSTRGEVNPPVNQDAFGMTRGFTVDAGSTTFDLLCKELDGVIHVNNSHMTAMFFPTQY